MAKNPLINLLLPEAMIRIVPSMSIQQAVKLALDELEQDYTYQWAREHANASTAHSVATRQRIKTIKSKAFYKAVLEKEQLRRLDTLL